MAIPLKPSISQIGDVLVSNIDQSIQWLDEDGNIITGANYHKFKPGDIGQYFVRYTDINGCNSTSEPYFYSLNTARKLNQALAFALYPNPATSAFTVQATQPGTYSLQVVNTQGQVVQQASFTGTQQLVSTTTLPAGVYSVHLQGPLGSGVQRLVVQ